MAEVIRVEMVRRASGDETPLRDSLDLGYNDGLEWRDERLKEWGVKSSRLLTSLNFERGPPPIGPPRSSTHTTIIRTQVVRSRPQLCALRSLSFPPGVVPHLHSFLPDSLACSDFHWRSTDVNEKCKLVSGECARTDRRSPRLFAAEFLRTWKKNGLATVAGNIKHSGQAPRGRWDEPQYKGNKQQTKTE